MLGDCMVALFGLIYTVFSLPMLGDVYEHPTLESHASYSHATLLVPIVAMMFLFSRPLRGHVKVASDSAVGATRNLF